VKWGEDNTVQPNLAEKWTIDPAGTLYTFKLRPNVKFSNGRTLNAEDVKFSLERACDPKFASPTAGTYLTDIIGVRERLAGTAKEISGIKVVDPTTVTIQIDKTRPYFLGKLTYACAYVVAKEAVGTAGATMTKPEQMIGTGPFIFDTIDSNRLVTLKAFKEYHEGAPKVDRIERPVVLDAVTRLNMYKQGQVDLIPLERQDVKAIQADDKLKGDLKFFDRPSTWYVGLNCNLLPALKDRRVRRALAMAVDRKTIVDGILGGQNVIATSIVPPGVPGHRENVAGVPYDVAGAKALLAQAGYPGGKGLPEIELSYRDGRPDVELVAQALQQQWKEALGVNLTLQ
ncbi:ABC transporter substrate-binding protein, partial [bacterium]